MDEEQQLMLMRVLGAVAINSGGEFRVPMDALLSADGTCLLREDFDTMSMVITYFKDGDAAQAALEAATAANTATAHSRGAVEALCANA